MRESANGVAARSQSKRSNRMLPSPHRHPFRARAALRRHWRGIGWFPKKKKKKLSCSFSLFLRTRRRPAGPFLAMFLLDTNRCQNWTQQRSTQLGSGCCAVARREVARSGFLLFFRVVRAAASGRCSGPFLAEAFSKRVTAKNGPAVGAGGPRGFFGCVAGASRSRTNHGPAVPETRRVRRHGRARCSGPFLAEAFSKRVTAKSGPALGDRVRRSSAPRPRGVVHFWRRLSLTRAARGLGRRAVAARRARDPCFLFPRGSETRQLGGPRAVRCGGPFLAEAFSNTSHRQKWTGRR